MTGEQFRALVTEVTKWLEPFVAAEVARRVNMDVRDCFSGWIESQVRREVTRLVGESVDVEVKVRRAPRR